MQAATLRLNTLIFSVAAILSGCAQFGTAPAPVSPDIISPFGDLVERPTRRFDGAWVKPDTEFGLYKGVILEPPELAFLTPDRSMRQFPLDDSQKRRFRDLLTEKFVEEFEQLEIMQVTTDPGPDVLRLKVRVRDIVATLPQRSKGGPGRFGDIALEALGEATLVLELRDAQSEQTLAVAVDAGAIKGAAFLQNDGPVLGWEGAAEACSRWAEAARKGLQQLVARE